MPLRIVRAPDVQSLWEECLESFLDELHGRSGPDGFESHLWLTHRNLRDLLFEHAGARGIEGWLGLPFAFFSQLPARFEIRHRPVGLLTRRRLLSRLAARLGKEVMQREPGRADGVIRGHMLDSLLSELLPGGVTPEQLRAGLDQVGGDEFARHRNRWLVAVYAQYLAELERRGEYDDRSIHAMISAAIDAGRLSKAIGGARALHVYGLYTRRHRERLFRSLADQSEVDVVLYVLSEDEPGEFDALGPSANQATREVAESIRVQPAPDAAREIDWVVRRVKGALHRQECAPWQVAIVARSGQQDTRRVYRALRRAGVPATARVRTPLSNIAALQALRMLFRGAAAGWTYRSLRELLAHPYFDTGLDLRSVDHIATVRRVEGLAAWQESLRRLLVRLEDESLARRFRGAGLYPDRVAKDIEAFAWLRPQLESLGVARTEAEWLEFSLQLLRNDFLHMRRRVCEPVGDRWDVVRLDQRGLLQLERLLHEWLQLDHRKELLDADRWHVLLTRLLAANELVLTTPTHKGVQVLEAHDAALVPFRRLFVIHANDGEFPRAPSASTVVSDEESRRLRAYGVNLPDREQRLRRERALWGAVVRQRAAVAITYRTTSAGGTPLLPSMLVPRHDPDSELPRTRVPRLVEGAESAPVTPAQADQLAVQRIAEATRAAATDGSGPGSVALECARPHRVEQALLAGVAEAHRHQAGTVLPDQHPALDPNPWNGQLRDPAVLAKLAESFGPEHRWSASALEAYARCPFGFLLERVLYIRDPAEADEETSALTFGAVAHHILERFYAGMVEHVPAALAGGAEEEFERVAEEVFTRHEDAGEWLGLPLLWASSREQIHRAVRDYLRWELPYLADQEERPIEVEQKFGRGAEPHLLEGPDLQGISVRMAVVGRIDRVDRAGTRKTVHDILDYKSGGTPSKGGYADGSTLQAALYLRVWESLGNPARKARYRSIKGAGKTANSAEIRVGKPEYESALACAFSIPARARAGLFEPVKSYWSGGWQPWDVGAEITRGRAQLSKGRSRFDG